jgi:hypothetical protein
LTLVDDDDAKIPHDIPNRRSFVYGFKIMTNLRGSMSEHGDSRVPKDVRDTGDERRLGADDDEVDVERAREPQQPVGVVRGDRVTRRERRDAGAARGGMELVE